MTIRLAPASRRNPVDRVLTVRVPTRAANDNLDGIAHDAVLQAALRHFAGHGLAAAERARENAEAAFFAANRDEYGRWLAICRTLDRRMADAVAARAGRL